MTGMDEVGRLFNANELIVAEVLQSAEAMKAAVSHLEQFMEKNEPSIARARSLLATVKGDVHDIGKNLVDIILSNNGYEVVNLGIKVPPEVLIEAAREHKPDAIGLSGLLVKSAQQMVITAGDLKDAGVDVPLLVGGAALSDRFTRGKIAAGVRVGHGRLLQRRDERPRDAEPADGSGAAHAARSGTARERAGRAHFDAGERSRAGDGAAQLKISLDVPIPDAGLAVDRDRRRARSNGNVTATRPTSIRSGATSTRRCSTAGTSASAGASARRSTRAT